MRGFWISWSGCRTHPSRVKVFITLCHYGVFCMFKFNIYRRVSSEFLADHHNLQDFLIKEAREAFSQTIRTHHLGSSKADEKLASFLQQKTNAIKQVWYRASYMCYFFTILRNIYLVNYFNSRHNPPWHTGVLSNQMICTCVNTWTFGVIGFCKYSHSLTQFGVFFPITGSDVNCKCRAWRYWSLTEFRQFFSIKRYIIRNIILSLTQCNLTHEPS